MNVIFYGSFLYPYGYAATKRKQQFIDYIKEKGDNVRVILSEKRAQGHQMNPYKGEFNGVPFEVINSYTQSPLLSLIISPYITYLTMKRLFKLYNKRGSNVIVLFCISSLRNFIIALWAKFLGYRIYNDVVEDFSVHGAPIRIRIRYLLYGNAINFMATKLIVNGTSVISKLLYDKYLRIVNDNKRLYNIPISASNFNMAKKRILDQSKNYIIFQYSGTYGNKERIDLIVKVLSNIKITHHKICLRLTGDCPMEVKKKIESIKGNLDIIFTGRLSETEYYDSLISADVLLMIRGNSSYSNAGFPFKLGEYLATGNPVVCTNVCGIDYYLDYSSAIIIPPDNYDSLYKAIQSIYENYDYYRLIGAKGREICLKHFNPQINSEIFYNMISNNS